ncbi:polysaccharide lyase family 1 protein [Nonomuraea fuscirosea]|uniref:pectate lyase family protein n=1 Tax=Nonomuraea fuscirosea TaxID=1291556 RepID=UPI0011B27D11|nr:polysaccharide lyase family 1 protein [Nonomuraea fuscirosea]
MAPASTTTRVWIDHNTLNDGDNPDSGQPRYFGRPYQVHDGLLDIVRGSNFVTLSCNHLSGHDKVTLIGNTDNPGRYGEQDKLKVTLHHNHFDRLGQRAPRVRFGQVHVYNNYYRGGDGHGYSIGVGFGSQVYADGNAFDGIEAAKVLTVFNGTAITARDNLVDGVPVDVAAAYNAANGTTLGGDAGWTPTLVPAGAGAGHLRQHHPPPEQRRLPAGGRRTGGWVWRGYPERPDLPFSGLASKHGHGEPARAVPAGPPRAAPARGPGPARRRPPPGVRPAP